MDGDNADIAGAIYLPLAAHLLERGLSLSAIANILGHEDLKTTALYAHLP